MIFVDTSGWYSISIPTDPDHKVATDWYSRNSQPLVTTDYILDELLTLLRARREHSRSLVIGSKILKETVARLEMVNWQDIAGAWQVYSTFRDKDWSFTDCVSRVVMERLGISTAFSFDDHFRQFGTVVVVPHKAS